MDVRQNEPCRKDESKISSFSIYITFGFFYIIIMSIILKIEWLNRYTDNCGPTGSVQGSFQAGLKFIKTEMEWFGLRIKEMSKPVDEHAGYPHSCVMRIAWFAEPAVMTGPPNQESGEYDQRLTIFDSMTGEVYYKTEMLKRNYKPGSSEPFDLCREVIWNIMKYQAIVPIVENLE